MAAETLKVSFRTSTSLPARRADCIEISGGNLKLKCKKPGYEIETLNFLLNTMKLKPYWMGMKTSDDTLALVENCTADIVGNIRGQHKVLTKDLLTARAGILYESSSFVFRKPQPGEYAWEESMLKSFRKDVWFSIIACIILAAFSIWLASHFRFSFFNSLFKIFQIFVTQSYDMKPKFISCILSLTYVVLFGYYNRILLANLMVRKVEISASMFNEDFGKFAIKNGFHMIGTPNARRRLLGGNDPQFPAFTEKLKRGMKVEENYGRMMQLIENSSNPSYLWVTSGQKASYAMSTHHDFISVNSLDGYFEYDSYLVCKKRKDLAQKLTKLVNMYRIILDRIMRKYTGKGGRNYSIRSSKQVRLKLIHFAFGFCIFAGGIFLSLFTFFCERSMLLSRNKHSAFSEQV